MTATGQNTHTGSINATSGKIAESSGSLPTTTHTITVRSSTGGMIDSVSHTTATAGTKITISASANSSYSFDYWSGNVTFANRYSSRTTFEMPDNDVSITAYFERKSSGSSGGSSGGNSGSSSKNTPSRQTVTAATAQKEANKAVSEAVKKAGKDNTAYASVNFQNVTSMTPSVFKNINSAASTDVKLTVHMDTATNGRVDARMYIDPKAAAKLGEPVKTIINVQENNTTNKSIVKLFDRYFENDIRAVSFEHRGSFGIPVTVAVKVDLNKFNLKKIKIYSYDITKNRYVLIEDPNFFVDGNGYAHVTVTSGGGLIFSDSKLERK